MDYLDHPFAVSTGSSRRPTPTEFVHLRKWLEKDERFLELHSYTDITDIDSQLDQSTKLMVSNVMQRVIAQIIGQRDPGFVTIKGTDDGELHVYAPGIGAITDSMVGVAAAGSLTAQLRRVTQALEDLKTMIEFPSGSKVEIEGPSQEELFAAFTCSAAGTDDITPNDATVKFHITSIMFTVNDVCTVKFYSDDIDLSGVMNFGGDNEPRGLTHNFGLIPLLCKPLKKFQMAIVGAGVVSGVATGYDA